MTTYQKANDVGGHRHAPDGTDRSTRASPSSRSAPRTVRASSRTGNTGGADPRLVACRDDQPDGGPLLHARGSGRRSDRPEDAGLARVRARTGRAVASREGRLAALGIRRDNPAAGRGRRLSRLRESDADRTEQHQQGEALVASLARFRTSGPINSTCIPTALRCHAFSPGQRLAILQL